MEMQDLIQKIDSPNLDIISIVSDRLGIPRYGCNLFGCSDNREERRAICDRIIEQMLAEVIQVKE